MLISQQELKGSLLTLQIQTPRWALPLLYPARYKGIKGGRGSGKSHFIAESYVEESVINPDMRFVCIREIQKSLKFSSKQVIEDKIKALGVSELFEITLTEIRRKEGNGLFIFQGMQDHTADSIKSLEGFDRAWVEEAQNLSARSLKLLRPTIRKENSEICFTWNPENEEDAIEQFWKDQPANSVLVHVNYNQNPFLPKTLYEEMLIDRGRDPDVFDHVWLGGYNKRSKARVLTKYSILEFEPDESYGEPLHGMDFGFAQDPTTGVRVYVKDNDLYVYQECGKVGLELDDTAYFMEQNIPKVGDYVIRADSARPESISYLKRQGLPRIEGVKKWAGSVEDGVTHIQKYDHVYIHPQCVGTIQEAKLYSYKIDKRTGDILPEIIDAYNHYIDAIRYALTPLIKRKGKGFFSS